MRQRKITAFTLIELLVVISIIVLLMGILLPYLGQAREQSRRAACMANLRSIGQSIYIYANDNDDKLIPGDCSVAWDIWGQKTGESGTDAQIFQHVNLGYLISSGILPIPNDNDHIFFCPSSRLPDGLRPYEHFANKWGCADKEAPISYMFNSDLDGFGNYVQMGDQPVLAHKDKINYLLGDGSVQTFRRTRLEFSGGRPELLQDIAARIGVCFPNFMIHNWLEQDRIDVALAMEYLQNPAEWMDRNSAFSTPGPVLLANVGKKSLVCDVVGAWSGESSPEEQTSTGHG
jgi:type II secretory pathway pseudopilin PulG